MCSRVIAGAYLEFPNSNPQPNVKVPIAPAETPTAPNKLQMNSKSSPKIIKIMGKRLFFLASAAAVIGLIVALGRRYGFAAESVMSTFRDLRDRLGVWAIPVFVLAHTLTLALCLPSAVLFETGASLLFGFFPAVLCVFSAKILGASLSFWIGRSVLNFLEFSW